MANFLFPGSAAVNKQPTIIPISLRIQSSMEGKPRPIAYGTNRVPGNLIWYGAYKMVPVSQTPAAGKGGIGAGSGGKGTTGTVTIGSPASPAPPQQPMNFASFALFLAEGPIVAVAAGNKIWNNKAVSTFGAAAVPNATGPGAAGDALGLVAFLGDYAQSPWGYLTTLYPTEADNYRGDAYVAAGPIYLGDSQELPQLSLEVNFAGAGGAFGSINADANPRYIINDFLSNVNYGVGFPTARIATNADFFLYVLACGMMLSPVIAEQHAAADYLKEWAQATNSDYVWSGGQLKIISYGDEAVTGNGFTYTPPAASGYSFTDVDYIAGVGAPPVQVVPRRIEDQKNSIKVEYLARDNDYNPAVYEAKNSAAIEAYGLNSASINKQYSITEIEVAVLCANLLLGREEVINTYTFTVPAKYILLEPMDIVSITDLDLGMSALPVRIVEITEQENYDLLIVAEDYPAGAATSPVVTGAGGAGAGSDLNASPGFTTAPVIFEPTDAAAGGNWIYMAIAGLDLTIWGGCEVWASYDDVTYKQVGSQLGSSNFGVTTAPLPAVTEAASGNTIDQTNTLSIDLTLGEGSAASHSQADVEAFNSLLWVDGEFIAWRDSTPTGTFTFDLDYLNRAGFNTDSDAHAAGSSVVVVDQGILRFPFTTDRIGSTVYFKFLSYNKYGGAKQALADVGPHTYVIQGTALSSPLPSVQSFTSVYQPNVTEFTWTEITDFRSPILYELRKGTTWEGGAFIGRYAHPPIPAIGDGTYWLNSFCQPAPGLDVYGDTPIGLSISGSILPQNVKATWNELATGATGTYTGSLIFDGTFIRTTGEGDILAASDVLAITDVLSYGPQADGTYEIPASHQIDVGYVAPCLVALFMSGQGVAANQNFFAYDPLFDVVDFFGAAATALVGVRAQLAISQDGVTWSEWFDYAAGTYNARRFKARVIVTPVDGTAIGFVTQFIFTVYVPTRVDNWAIINGQRTSLNNLVLPSAGSVLTFVPDRQLSGSAPFNGGVSATGQPSIIGTILNWQPGDTLVVTQVTLATAKVQVMNAGVGVSRTVNIRPEGY